MKRTPDKYGGLTIDGTTLPTSLKKFENSLNKIISDEQDKKLLWITLPISKSNYIPLLTEYDFVFYDCTETSITLLKRLIANPIIPTATNHTIGVGAFVIDDDEILVVKDSTYKQLKLPGGYIDNNENISQAVVREVYEETGVNVSPQSIVTLGHFSPCQFGESNIYIVCKAKPLSKEIDIQDDQEIIEARWIGIEEYLNCKDVHVYNKRIIESAMENKGILLDAGTFFTDKDNQHEFYF
jgi:8-oxo-dGTP diphosphatase